MNLRRTCNPMLVVGALAAGAASAAPAALTIEYERILGSDTSIPGSSGFFFNRMNGFRLTHRAGRILFTNAAGIIPPSKNGVFSFSESSISTVAVLGQPPFTDEAGRAFDDPHFDGDTQVFFASGVFGVAETYVSVAGETPRLLVANGDPTDGAAAVNSYTLTPRVLGDQIVLGTVDTLGSSRVERVAASGGVPQTLFDASTPLEPQGADDDLIAYALGGSSGDRFAFWGQDQFGFVRGIFVGGLSGESVPVARSGEPAPGAPGSVFETFTSFPSLDGDTAAFTGAAVGGVSTVYTADTATGAIEAVADVTSTIINEPFSGLPVITTLRAASVSDGNVGFIGQSSDGFTQAIFVMFEGELLEIARNREVFDGKTLSVIMGSSFSLDGNQYVFTAQFTDGSTGLYRATIVPAPAAALLALASVLLGVRQRRR